MEGDPYELEKKLAMEQEVERVDEVEEEAKQVFEDNDSVNANISDAGSNAFTDSFEIIDEDSVQEPTPNRIMRDYTFTETQSLFTT